MSSERLALATRPAANLRYVALTIAVVVLATTLVGAHAELLRTEPADGSVLASAPSRMRLSFSEPIDVVANAVTITGPDGVRVDRRDAATVPDDPTSLQTTIDARSEGTYTVQWRAISADGHTIGGTVHFSVGTESAALTRSLPSSVPADISLQAASRWWQLVFLSVLIGPLALTILVLQSPRDSRMERALATLSWYGALGMVGGVLLALVVQTAAVGGSLLEGGSVATLRGLLGTSWGRLWTASAVAIFAVAALSTSALVSTRRGFTTTLRLRMTIVALSAIVISLMTFNGHSGVTAPVWVSIAVDWIHLAATAVWLGGLFALVLVFLPMLRHFDRDSRGALVAVTVSRFSIVGLICVELLILTGLYHTWAHVDGPAKLMSTPYGRTLLVKLGLIAAMLVPASVNLLILRPRLAGRSKVAAATDIRGLRLMIGIEAALGVCVLAAVGLLTSLPTATAAERPAAAAPSVGRWSDDASVTFADRAGDMLVTVRLSPGRVGANDIELDVQDSNGQRTADAQLRLRISPPDGSGIAPWSVIPSKRGDRYTATIALSPEGTWTLEPSVTVANANVGSARIAVGVPVRGAGELLVAAAEAMNRLHSVVEEIDATAKGVHQVTRIEHQAPDRERTSGDMLHVKIGSASYMRHGETWTAGATAPVEWPKYAFAVHATDVAILGRESIDGIECLIVGYADTGDGSRNRLWISVETMRVLRQSSAAAGRFATRRFSRFDAPIVIAAPDLRGK